MKLRSLTVAPGRAVPGMTLARAVCDRDGNTLLAVGTELSSATIEGLLRRHVETVSVVVADLRDARTIAEEVREARERVETIFRGPLDGARAELYAAVLDYRLRQAR